VPKIHLGDHSGVDQK